MLVVYTEVLFIDNTRGRFCCHYSDYGELNALPLSSIFYALLTIHVVYMYISLRPLYVHTYICNSNMLAYCTISTQVRALRNKHVMAVGVGRYHTAVSTSTEVYTFGKNLGQLGYDKVYVTQIVPRAVSLMDPLCVCVCVCDTDCTQSCESCVCVCVCVTQIVPRAMSLMDPLCVCVYCQVPVIILYMCVYVFTARCLS